MGKLKLFLTFIISLCFHYASAQWDIVIDPRAISQVEANTAMQLGVELAHNQDLDSILAKQEEILAKTSFIAGAKELTIQTLKNTNDFGMESSFYISIAKTSTEIFDLSPKIIEALAHSGIVNKAAMALVVSDLVERASSCVKNFIDIVNNAKFKAPLKGVNTGKGDGHNLLDRYERIRLANKIDVDLKRIRNKMNYLLFVSQNSSWSDLLYVLDFKTWAHMCNGKSISETLMRKWDSFIK